MCRWNEIIKHKRIECNIIRELMLAQNSDDLKVLNEQVFS